MKSTPPTCAKCGSLQSEDGSCPSCMLTTAAWDEGQCEADRIFQVALSYHLSERDAFVEAACADKPELLEEVRMMLRGFAEEGGDGALPTMPGEAVSARAAWAAQREETPGAIIGHFELVRLIGQGGMGSVWEARQVQPVVRRVALKVIKLGMDTREVVARFERERQALALMNHPHIAQVFEAGATELGRPYFVMELVRGRPITQYRKEEDLDIRPTLELFLQLCGAIEHAHQKGVIHRDLKPSNILVSTDGALKVIDFGVAKATRESGDMDQTRQAQVLGTPSYMSPEQALGNGVDVDTRTDVYALGVVLYELLCGALPFEPSRLAVGVTEMQRILRDEEPQRPSAQRGRSGKPGMTEIRRKSVRGDLDWITLKCLEKDRRRRYASARALADDVSSYLESRPVTAAPPRRLYYAKKWVARHRVVFAAGVAVAGSLLLGSIVSLAQARRAGQEADRAKLARGEAERLLRISHHEEGKAWLERARALGKERNFFAAKLMAGRALGFEGFGRAEADGAFRERYPVLLDPGSAESGAARTILSGSRSYAMLWQSPSSAHHDGRVVGVAMSGDGALVASCAAGENGIRVHGREDGKLKYLLESPAAHPMGVAFSADGKWLAAAGEGTAVPVWEVATGRLAYVLEGPARRRTRVHFSADGKFLGAAGTSGGVVLWDLESRTVARSMGAGGAVVDFSMSADGARMAVLEADSVFRIFDTATGNLLKTFEVKSEMKADAMALHPDGNRLYGGFVTGKTVEWDVSTGQRGTVRFEDHRQPVSSLVVSPDGKWLASGSREGMVRLSETAAGKEVLMMTAHPDRILDMGFSGDGRWLATGSEDQTVGIRDMRDGRRLHEMPGHSASVHALAMSPDGRSFASAGADQTVRFWDPAGGAERVLITGEVAEIQGLDYSPSGAWLVTASHYGTVKFWNVEDGKRVGTRGVMQKSGVSAVRFLSEDSIVTAGYDGTVRRWETTKGKETGSHAAHAGEVLCLDTAEGGKLIATGGADRAVILWRPDGKEEPRRLTGHTSAVTAVRFSPDGRTLASADRSGTLRFWDLESGLLKNSVISSAQALTSIDYRPDGARLVAAGQDGAVRLWNVETWKLEAVMEGHLRAVNAVRFCQDGTAVVTAGDDRTVAVWDAGGKETQSRQAHRGALQSLLWEEGSLVSGGADGRVRRWSETYLREEESWEHPEGAAPVLAEDERYLVSAGKGGRLRIRDRRSGEVSSTVQAHRDQVLSAVFKPGGGELATLSLDGTLRIWEPGAWRLKRSLGLVEGAGEEVRPTGGCLCYSRDGKR
ncbi:MAG: pknB 12, partial [Verrucomicrobiales bacterium]|nr:pknB 12 [Verrucomicrobiales bacterium]